MRRLLRLFWAMPSWRKGLLITLAVVSVVIALSIEVPSPAAFRGWVDSYGNAALIAFWLAYVGFTQLPIPRTVFTLSSGLLFGPAWGIIVAISATTVSAMLSLCVVRGLCGRWLSWEAIGPGRFTHKYPAVQRVYERLNNRGWLAVASLRMIAAVPFSILNYLAAITPVGYASFALATAVGSLPGTIATVLLGDAFVAGINRRLLIASVCIAIVGCIGLLVDYRTPVKPRT